MALPLVQHDFTATAAIRRATWSQSRACHSRGVSCWWVHARTLRYSWLVVPQAMTSLGSSVVRVHNDRDIRDGLWIVPASSSDGGVCQIRLV